MNDSNHSIRVKLNPFRQQLSDTQPGGWMFNCTAKDCESLFLPPLGGSLEQSGQFAIRAGWSQDERGRWICPQCACAVPPPVAIDSVTP